MNRIVSGLAALIFAVGPIEAAIAQSSDADWAKVITAAKKEGTVALYTSDTATKCGPAFNKWFSETYGIQVQNLAARGVEIDERIRIEQAAAHYTADVYVNGGAAAYLKAEQGVLTPYADFPNLKLVLPQYLNDNHRWLTLHDNPISFVVNTDHVAPADDPKSWSDLLAPKWKGKILSDDLRVQGNGLNTFEGVYKLHGAEYWKTMAATQDVTFDRDFGKAMRRVGSGEYLVYIAMLSSYFVSGAGLPVKYGLPSEGIPHAMNGIGLVKGAPHPNAALLFLDEQFAPQWQVACANEGSIPTIAAIEDKLEAFPKALRAQNNLGHLDYPPEQVGQWIARAKEIFP